MDGGVTACLWAERRWDSPVSLKHHCPQGTTVQRSQGLDCAVGRLPVSVLLPVVSGASTGGGGIAGNGGDGRHPETLKAALGLSRGVQSHRGDSCDDRHLTADLLCGCRKEAALCESFKKSLRFWVTVCRWPEAVK